MKFFNMFFLFIFIFIFVVIEGFLMCLNSLGKCFGKIIILISQSIVSISAIEVHVK